jgi:two-component system nitrate/nitrite response regulator NarL
VTTDWGTILIAGEARPRTVLAAIFRRAGYTTQEANTGHEALAAVELERPALVVLEVKLSGMSGYEVCHQLKERYGDGLPVVFVSSKTTEPHERVAGLLIGADDYVARPFDPDELLIRARRLIARSGGPTRVNGHTNGASNGLPRSQPCLTAREREVLSLLGAGLPQTAIAATLFISQKTVGTHIQRILAKLGVHSRAQAVAYAHREGLVGDFVAHALVEDKPPRVDRRAAVAERRAPVVA